jgi:hypothetical protein
MPHLSPPTLTHSANRMSALLVQSRPCSCEQAPLGYPLDESASECLVAQLTTICPS